MQDDQRYVLPPDLPEEVRQYLTRLNDVVSGKSNICPVCGAPVEHFEQVGRSVYAVPCGHRLYQGHVPRSSGDSTR